MNELHLFVGCGGGVLGGVLCGNTVVCAVEIDPYRRKSLLQRQRDGVLSRFPIWDDVRTFDANPWRERVDIIKAGFPCDDISPAGKRLALMDRSLPCSLRFSESQTRFDLNTCSWKTAGTLFAEDLQESSVSLLGWGMLLNGVVWEPVTSEPTTKGFGLGLFPTPMTGNEKWNGTFQEGGGSLNKWRETWLGRQWINPGFWEEIMGWPIGWTDLQPLGRDKFQQWRDSHGKY